MAEPARESASRTGSCEHARPNPLTPGWADVRGLMIIYAELAALAAADLAARPDCPAALRRADLIIAGQKYSNEIASRCAIDESILAAREAEAYERGVADCKAARCRLEAVPGPH